MFSDTTNPPMPSKVQTRSRTSDHPRSLHLFVSLHLQHFYPFNLSVFCSAAIHMEIKAFTDFHKKSTHAKHLVSFIESPRFEEIMEMDHIPPPKISFFLSTPSLFSVHSHLSLLHCPWASTSFLPLACGTILFSSALSPKPKSRKKFMGHKWRGKSHLVNITDSS